MAENKEKLVRKFTGTVVSNKMDKTVVVQVTRVKIHPKYGKRYKVSRKYHAHDAKNEYQVGDKVEIKEIRPLAKTKKWVVINKVK